MAGTALSERLQIDRQRAVTFENREGHRLFGILHEPAGPERRRTGVILLSPGVKSRVAPHRLYNKMAAEFVAAGYVVFRFDFYGLGDSEGEIPEPLLADLYGAVQVGRYADDTRCAIDWLQRSCGVDRVVLAGLCGGAITGLLAGAGDPRIVGLLGLGIPVMLDGSSVDKIKNMTAGQLTNMRQRYVKKLLNPSAWLRVLTLKTDFRLFLRALTVRRGAPAPAAAGAAPAGSAPANGATANGAPTNANPHFPPALFRMLADRRPVLFVFSGADRLYAEYQEKFAACHGGRLARHGQVLEVAVIEQANHVFTFRAWQDEMLRRTRAWLVEHYPASVAPAVTV